MRRRWLTIGGLTALFLFIFLGLASCSIPETIDPQSLQNSLGGNNGPGSGEWKPRAPRTADRCRQFHGVLTNLQKESGELASRIDTLYVRCFDEEGFLLPDADPDACWQPVNELMSNLRVRYLDFETGIKVYDEACVGQFAEALNAPLAGALPQLPPRYTGMTGDDDPDEGTTSLGYTWCLTCIDGPPPKPPEDDPEGPKPTTEPRATTPPDTQDPEGGGSKCCRCLTCINNIDIDYTIVEGPVFLPDS